MHKKSIFNIIKSILLATILLCSMVLSENDANPDETIVVELGDYNGTINIAIEEEFILKGDLFEVTRQLWFYDLNKTDN